MAEVACPLGDCGYTGPMRSVEAHISGNTDDDHRGEVGRLHRESLVSQVEDEQTGEETNTDEQGSSGSPEVVADGGPEQVEETGEETSDEASDDGLSIDPGMALLAASALFLLIVVVSVWTGSEETTETGETTEETDSEESEADANEVSLLE